MWSMNDQAQVALAQNEEFPGSSSSPGQEMTVIVLYDRGIASRKLWQQIRVQG